MCATLILELERQNSYDCKRAVMSEADVNKATVRHLSHSLFVLLIHSSFFQTTETEHTKTYYADLMKKDL